jgi:hypothetical protein
MNRHDILNTETQPMEVIPPAALAIEPPFSQWTHYNPILVEVLAEHGGVPKREVVDHLSALHDEAYNNNLPTARPLDRPSWVLQNYLDEFVAVG